MARDTQICPKDWNTLIFQFWTSVWSTRSLRWIGGFLSFIFIGHATGWILYICSNKKFSTLFRGLIKSQTVQLIILEKENKSKSESHKRNSIISKSEIIYFKVAFKINSFVLFEEIVTSPINEIIAIIILCIECNFKKFQKFKNDAIFESL